MLKRQQSSIARFFRLEAAGGILLMVSAALAVIIANSPFRPYYDLLLNTPVEIRIDGFEIAKPLLLWINDGLMAVFFFLVGLELKREVVEGELSDKRKIILPGIGAIGGMVVPAFIYILINFKDPVALKGWAIPAATDIAFSLGVLSLLGTRVPTSLKVFLTSLAIFDDIGAIIIIALFYTSKISISSLLVVLCCIPVLIVMNLKEVVSKSAYIAVGIIIWASMLKSGVHATLSGVLLAAFVPLRTKSDPASSPLKDFEHDLHSVVAFLVLPVFAYVNAGVSFIGMEARQLFHPVSVGVALGLILGKQLGIFGCCWAAIRLGWASLPRGMSMQSLYGTAAICGIGFTMSLFIGSLAFEETGMKLVFDERLGIIIGSLVSGVIGFLILKKALPEERGA